jgi:L-seryl-tRNA(Ser) seleniumtransferase
MKVGREEIAGLLVALELYLARDHAAERARLVAIVTQIANALHGVGGCICIAQIPEGGGSPVARLTFDENRPGWNAIEVARSLRDGTPRVFLSEAEIAAGCLIINPHHLRDEEIDTVITSVQTRLDSKRRTEG